MPEFIISPMRVMTLPEINFFYIAGRPVPLADASHRRVCMPSQRSHGGAGALCQPHPGSL
jgi:hypothetical protein